jgi:hypothetical protein
MPKKNSDKTTDKTADKKKGFQPSKRRGGGADKPDDSDEDSKGNIKGLIDYDYDSDEDYTTEELTESSGKSSTKSPIARRTRSKKGLLQKKRVVESESESDLTESEESESEEEEKPIRKNTLRKKITANRIRREKEEKQAQKLKKKQEQEQEEDDELAALEEELERKRRKRRAIRRRLREAEEEEEMEEEEDEEEEEEEEETDEEEDEEEEEEVEEEDERGGIIFSIGGLDDGADRLIPKRHNMKKESADVKKFVKLVTTPNDEDTIDGQIDQFKALPEDQKAKLLKVLEARNAPTTPTQGLMFKILTMNMPTETQSMVLSKYNSLQSLDPGSSEYYKMRNWLEKLTSMPLGIYKELPVKITDGSETCGSFMEKARRSLDEAIYGQDEAKLQILQFIGTKIANPDGRGLSLLLAGPPGIGKTSLIKNGVAKALQWPFQFISLGGDSDASTYTGHQMVYEGSHCGKIVNSLVAAKSMSLVLMFDEVDKISTTPKGEEVQNLLVHLTDSTQNDGFEDKYLSGIPIDLSRVMFTFSANYLDRIDKVLLDRMIVINLQGYSTKEKVAIAENYLLPNALKEVGLTEKVALAKDVITHVLTEYASEEVGVRELKRCMEQIAQKVNMLRMFNTKELPFHIKDFSLPFTVKREHVDLFLKKKKNSDASALHMYI